MKEIIEYVKVRYFSTMSEKGQGIVKYALILAFVVVVAAAITNSGGLRNKIADVFNNVVGAF